jgi:catechol 2,3-dioxygenase-like lactoylglutathione lyase family enzyme
MTQRIGYVALVVREYDEAINFFTGKLGFELLEDTAFPEKRWVLVRPPGSQGADLLLARATTAEQHQCVGRQTSGRVAFFLHTDDFWRDYQTYLARGVQFVRPPTTESYGTAAVFLDLYGNKWDLLQLN